MKKRCSKCEDYRTDAAKFQDEKHGKGMRIHNPMSKTGQGKVRCTVCGDEKQK